MEESGYQSPSAQVIYFLETDLITVSGTKSQDPDLGEWDAEM